jgi:hypothetical protein
VRIHRQWFILGGASLIFLVAGSALGVSEIEKTSRGPAYHLTATCLRVNHKARQLLGVITGYGLPSGPVHENSDGTGDARLSFDVVGSARAGRAQVEAVERDNRWYWQGEGTLTVAGQRYRLHLDKVSAVHPRRYFGLCGLPPSTTFFPKP